jgi:hypothetical protein
MSRVRLQVGFDGFAVFIHGAVQVNPLATHLEVGLIAAPGITDRTFMGLPAFLEFEGVAHDPTQDRARGNAYSQLRSQFGEVAVARTSNAS